MGIKKIEKIIFLFSLTCLSPAEAMMVSGPVTATAVTVSGDVVMSSVTASTVTVTTQLNVVGATLNVPGRIVQIKFSSSTFETQVSTTSWTPVTDIAQSITLLNASDYVRVSLSGGIAAGDTPSPTYLTIYRDMTNLGDSSVGLSAAFADSISTRQVFVTAGITLIDFPGDTSSHLYQAFIRAGNSGANESIFPWNSTGYLLLEEISR